MLNRRLFAAAAIGALGVASSVSAQTEQEWDGLQRVDSTRFRSAFLAPGADFSGYTKVMLDPTEAAFTRNWQRDFNSTTSSLSGRITNRDAQQILEQVQTGFHQSLTNAYQNAGIEIVTEPAPEVLRVRTAVVNIRVSAPDRMQPGRTRTYSSDAGQATLVLEVRDSMSGAVLGRAVDAQRVDDSGFMMRRNRATNRWDFGRTFDRWSTNSVDALNALRALPAPAVASGASSH